MLRVKEVSFCYHDFSCILAIFRYTLSLVTFSPCITDCFFVNTLAVPTDLLVAAVDLFTRRVAVHVGHSGARGVYPVHDYVRHRPVCVCVCAHLQPPHTLNPSTFAQR